MTGLAMMLRALGVEVDPEAIQGFITNSMRDLPIVVNRVQELLISIDRRLAVIHEQNVAELAMLADLRAKLLLPSEPVDSTAPPGPGQTTLRGKATNGSANPH